MGRVFQCEEYILSKIYLIEVKSYNSQWSGKGTKNMGMHKELEGKVALITGAARRIGAEIARTLHADGMKVILHYNVSQEEALSLCNQLNEIRKGSALALRAELQNSESAKSLIKQSLESWKRLDVLINNASRFYRTEIGKVTEYAWDDLLNSNLKMPFFLAQAALSALTEREGSIINITDIHTERSLRDFPIYSLSKGALTTLTKILAKEVGPCVRVNAVAPGAILWPEGANALSEKEKEHIIKHTALKRAGDPKDIAKAVLFLLKDAHYITGQILNVDGGRSVSL